MSNVLTLKNVTKDYGDFKLDQVSFSVPEGCICGFIGQNGAGKTTTIKLLLNIIKKDSGQITLFDQNLEDADVSIKEEIGVVFDEMGFHEFMTASDINYMMKNVYKNWQEETFFRYLKKFSLPTKKRCGSFSRGMQMKLQIAVALSHNARLLLMDEPTSGLDPIVRNEILQIFQEYVLEENHTILLSSHITADLDRIADEVVFINHGKIVLAGNKEELLEAHGLVKCKKKELSAIDETFLISSRQSSFGAEVLICDKEKFVQQYPEVTVEPVGIEDLMLFYVNRNSQTVHSEE